MFARTDNLARTLTLIRRYEWVHRVQFEGDQFDDQEEELQRHRHQRVDFCMWNCTQQQ
jgi:hypothetical protein